MSEMLHFGSYFLEVEDFEEGKQQIRKRLLCGTESCRLNLYWGRTSAGVHHKGEGIDFAYFPCKSKNQLHWAAQMAIAGKASELLASRLHLQGSDVQSIVRILYQKNNLLKTTRETHPPFCCHVGVFHLTRPKTHHYPCFT